MSNVLYLETDEDITSAVEKLKGSEGSDVQVVVPKRSTLLQSMINLKLLKRAADDSKKNLVLVTTDRLSSHLAGRVGLAVADKLNGQAKIPETAVEEPDPTEVIDGGVAETGAAETAAEKSVPDKPIADQKKPVVTPKADAAKATDDAMPLPGAESTAEAVTPVMTAKALEDDESKPTKAKGSRVPDFNALQKRILWGSLVVGVLIVAFLANWFLTKASVVVYAKGSQIPVTASFTADPAAASTNVSSGDLKAQDLTSSKDLSEQVAATGQQNVGTKASGSITVTNHCYNPGTLAAGTTFSSGDGHKFLSNAATAVPDGSISGGNCHATTVTVAVTASDNGDDYNLGPTAYSVASIPSSGAFYMTFAGSQMSGGTSKVVTVVQQSDIDGAVKDMLSKDLSGATSDLSGKAPSGYKFINETLTQTQSNVSSDTAVGGQASNVTVKVTASYDALAIASGDLDKLLTNQAIQQAGADSQVYDDGAGSAAFTQVSKNPNGSQQLKVTATASAGPKIDIAAIASQIKGKKYGDATDLMGKLPGVDHATVSLSPGWATSLPSRTSQIKITIKVVSSSG